MCTSSEREWMAFSDFWFSFHFSLVGKNRSSLSSCYVDLYIFTEFAFIRVQIVFKLTWPETQAYSKISGRPADSTIIGLRHENLQLAVIADMRNSFGRPAVATS